MATEPLIGTKIKRARERKRWTQRQLAGAVGVNVKTIDNWENDRTAPRNSIGALEQVLGIDLTGGEPAPGPLDDLLPVQEEWEQGVLDDPALSDDLKRRFIRDSRLARSAYAARRSRRRAEEQREVTRRATDQAS
jgi:transcriptional regulator with XRE-family HTH domain